MPAQVPDVGTGATVEFGTSLLVLENVKITIGEISRAEIDTTHLATPVAGAGEVNAATSIPGKRVRLESIELESHDDPAIAALLLAQPETITVTYGDGSTLVGSGYVSKYTPGPHEDDVKRMANVRIKPSGAWVLTEAA